jgi:hypothetical protein
MEIGVLASTAIAILIPFLKSLVDGMVKKTGEEIGVKTGDYLWNRASKLHKAIKIKFSSLPTAQETLIALEKSPDNTVMQEKLRYALINMFEKDIEFAKEITLITNETIITSNESSIQTIINGDVGSVTNIGNVQGDVHIG